MPSTVPRIGKGTLIQRFIDGVKLSGWNVLVLADGHPAKLAIFRGQERAVVLLYIWNMTYGGYPRNTDELRIQITGVIHSIDNRDRYFWMEKRLAMWVDET